MLNILFNSIQIKIVMEKLDFFENLSFFFVNCMFICWLWGMMFFIVVFCFLFWIQNIQFKGKVIILNLDYCLQIIYLIIVGRVEKWYVQEGQLVKKGDIILYLLEIKVEYFDN